MGFYIIATIFLVLASLTGIIHLYNSLEHYKARAQNQWHQINVQLQRRYDLIPNLVETARTTMNFEKSTLESVIQARNCAVQALSATQGELNAQRIQKLSQADQILSGTLQNFFAVVEKYPDLRSVENMKHLHEELVSTENRIAFARQAYNDAVMYYNESQMRIPSKWIAGLGGHHPMDFYPLSSDEMREPVRVQF
ncbi:LemA family protein [Candidatus Similichlamydia epinepheli]|uniref:LemA family protein n=1 Tax=Candidatus Similichlamydia epinepheli TaxID=1903953 RepID=UPI000D382AE3|nr:LemA family protein [Candidatus Similichlamydia epinepheli]